MLLGLIGGWLIYHATRWGPWAFSDATGYIQASRNLLAGHGIGLYLPTGEFSPGVSHPPLYVISLAAVSALGSDPIVAARALDVLLFASFVTLCGLLAWRISSSYWFGLATAALYLIHPQLVLIFLSAMSDSLFVLLGTLALLLLTRHLATGSNPALYGSALLAGLALLTRYPGLAYLATGSLLLLGRRGWLRTRIVQASGYLAIGLTPTGYFVLRASMLAESEAPRQLAVAADLPATMAEFGSKLISALWTWKPIPPAPLLPGWIGQLLASDPVRQVMLLLGIAAGIACLWLAYQALTSGPGSPDSLPERRLVTVFGTFTLLYLCFFLAAFTLTYPVPDLNSRTMLPMLPALILVSLSIGRMILLHWKHVPAALSLGAVILASALFGYAVISADTIVGMHRTGLGYTGRAWRQSELIAHIERLPATTPVITNEPSAVTLLTGRTPYPVPLAVLQSDVSTFGDGNTNAEIAFREHGGVLVLFETIDQQLRDLHGDGAADRRELLTRGLNRSLQAPDGAIYVNPADRP